MRAAFAAVLLLASTTALLAEPDFALMDESQGLWVLSRADGNSCQLTLGDELMDHDARRLDGAGDCRAVDGSIASATAWRIDAPNTLVFLNAAGKVVLKMKYEEENIVFITSGRQPELDLAPAQ